MDINLQTFSDRIDIYLLSSPRRKRKTGQLRPLHHFVGHNLDQSLFQCLQTCLVLFFCSDLVGVTQSRAVAILIPPTNLQKVQITIQTLWFGLTFFYASFQNQPQNEVVFLYKLDGKWEVENLKRISVVRRLQYVLNSVEIKNL